MKLRQKVGSSSLALSVWSDCGGMAMDMLSLHDIHDAVQRRSYLSISAELVCYCDANPACRRFAASNFLPKHFANDIMARDFDKRTYACTTHDTDHAFPEHIDIYSCCFPSH